MRCVLALILAFLIAPTALAESPPPVAQRQLKVFDFEERAQGNLESTPMGWLKVEGDGLPHYVNGTFDTDVSRSAKTSFRFDLNGGSLVYRYPAGKIIVLDGAAYRVEAWVRTSGLKRARARVTAYFADVDNHPMLSTLRHSEAFNGIDGNTDWHLLSIDMPATHPDAHSLILELSLLQPALLGADAGGLSPLMEDIHGSAWFDDVTIAQVPRVSIHTTQATNIFPKSMPVRISVQVKDSITQDLTARLEVRGADGTLAYQRTGRLSMDVPHDDAQRVLEGMIELPDLAAGWYEASIELTSQNQKVGHEVIRFIKLGDDDHEGTRGDDRFGVIATNLPPDAWPLAPTILHGTGFGRIKLAVWSDAGAAENDPNLVFTKIIEDLNTRGVQLTACLASIPPELQQKSGATKWADLLDSKGDVWQKQLAYLVSRHANHIQHWQLFTDSQAEDLVHDNKLRQVYEQMLAQFTKLEADPDLAMPWPAWYELEGNLPATIALTVPSQVLPEQLPLYAAELRDKPGHRLSLSLQPLDLAKYGREEQIRDLTLRIAFALSSGIERIDVPLPLSIRKVGGDLDDQITSISEPDELYLILRTLTAQLSGATFRGRVPLGPGVEAFLFDRDGVGVLLVWSKSTASATPAAPINATLGGSPRKVDLWGNISSLPRIVRTRARSTQTQIAVDRMPILITGVDAPLLRFGASLAIDNPLIESSFHTHERKLKVTNPFPQAISGSIHVRGPTGWTISLSQTGFSLNPGDSVELPMTIEFPFNSYSGEKTLVADVTIQGTQDYDLNIPLTVKLGLSDVGVSTLAVRNGDELVVQQVITNYGTKPINYTAFVSVPGLPRQERLVTNLAPGKSTIKKYRFPTATQQPGLKIRSGVREIEGPRGLNELVEVY